MNTFFGILGDALPTSGTRLSVLSMELPRAITPELAGLTVGAFVGVVGFIAVLLLVGRGNRRGAERRAQELQLQPQMQHAPRRPPQPQVVVAPYGTLQRDTPLPPAAFQVPSVPSGGQVLPFRPSTDLSARVFAKMGYGVEGDDERDSPAASPEVTVGDDDIHTKAWASPLPAIPLAIPGPPAVPVITPVSVSSIIVVEESGPVSAMKSGPHPLGIIPSGSSAMQARPASFADLDLDDGATEIGEPYFDEPPQPRRRTDPPKIRPVAPSGPRFPAAAAQQLPQPTPPPARVSQQR